jgi:hypothetical protein
LDHKIVDRKAKLQDTTNATDASHEFSAESASISPKFFPEGCQTQHITAFHSSAKDQSFWPCRLGLLAEQQTDASEKEPI